MRIGASAPRRRLLIFAEMPSVDVGLDFLEDVLAPSRGQLNVAVDGALAPICCDPAASPALGALSVCPHTIHDAPFKPLQGKSTGTCLPESWTESSDGVSLEFKPRHGLTFPHGIAVRTDFVSRRDGSAGS
jgi:hypothetical protein